MKGRNRGFGNGYRRSKSMMTGRISPGSRTSPEGSMRGRGFYDSEYRNYDRGGFGGGMRLIFQTRQSPARRGDVFVEASRLAVEYLVSKGILPPNSLSGMWQNNGLKNYVGHFPSVRSQDGESVPLPADSRPSTIFRFGNASDQGFGRKKFDDYERRPGPLKSYDESIKELERNGSWAGRPKDTLNIDDEGHTPSSSKNDNQVGKDTDSGLQSFPPSEATQKSDSVGEAESPIGKGNLMEVKKETEDSIISNTEVAGQNSVSCDVKPARDSGDVKIYDVEGGEIRYKSNNDDEQEVEKEEKSLEPCVDKDNQEIRPDSELLRTRSSLTKSVKTEQEHITEVKDVNMIELSNVHSVNVWDDSSSISDLSNPGLTSNNICSYLKEESAANVEGGLASFNGRERSKSLAMFSDKPIKKELGGNDTVPEFQRSESISVNRGEKRTLEDDDSWDGTKKPRVGFPPDSCLKDKVDEVIDLENDSVQEDKDDNCSDRRSDSVFTGLENFHSNSHHNNELPDVQDGYGLMISDLLVNDLSNCSVIQPDINSLHNDMELHNGEETLGDDDSDTNPTVVAKQCLTYSRRKSR